MENEKNGEKLNATMIKVATFIVDRRNLFFLLFGLLIVFSVFSVNWVKVENQLSAFLPQTTETRQGLDRMEEEFITYGTAQIMVTNISYEKADEILEEIQATEGVSMVAFEDSEEHYNNFSALGILKGYHGNTL